MKKMYSLLPDGTMKKIPKSKQGTYKYYCKECNAELSSEEELGTGVCASCRHDAFMARRDWRRYDRP